MVEKHKHCIVCGISIDPDKEPPICSKKCEYIWGKRVRRERIAVTLPFIFIIAFIGVMFLISILSGR
ncbi:MAG: DUF2116 family Zn-ribbon domain-containing protein [Candidatus Bathyarchaeota archaeon]